MGKAWHRMLRRKATKCSDPTLLDTQCGGIQKRAADFASAYVRMQLISARRRKCSAAAIFLDVVAAFYEMIREGALTLPTSRLDWIQFLVQAQWAPSDAEALLAALDQPLAESAKALPQHLLASTSAAHTATWLMLPGDSTLYSFLRGALPGDPFAD